MLADKLRKSVLQSAIQGKLTEQLATDDKVEDLLQAIKEEKELLIKEKKIKKQKPLPEITEEEIPFAIPENWKWVRLGEVILLNMGQSPNSEDVGNDGIEFHQGKIYFTDEIIGFSDKYCSKPKKISNANEILLSVRAPVGEVNLNNREICIGRGLASIKIINSEERYFFYLLFYCKKIFEKKSTGTTFKAISKDIIENLLIPLPPLAEQKRIVEKLDNVLANIDELKVSEEKLSILQKNFPDKLKKSILQSAIQGKLTEQLATDDNVEDLLQAIKEEKERLIKEKKIKKQKPLPEITEEEIPFAIPESWKWVRLGEITSIKGGKRIPVGKKLTTVNTGYKYIRVADMKNGTVIDTDIHYIDEEIYKKISAYTISKNDVYITCAGTIGRIGIVPDFFDGANLTENADKIILYFINKLWLCYALNSEAIQNQIRNVTTKVGQPKLAIKRIENMIIPLPPLAEQKRIVEKLDKLLADIEELKIE